MRVQNADDEKWMQQLMIIAPGANRRYLIPNTNYSTVQ
jgi:hypothetical protein